MTPASVHTAYDAALMGQDPMPRLVALHSVGQRNERQMRLYQRTEDGTGILTHDVPFYPFFFLDDIKWMRDFPRGAFKFQKLNGENPYQYLIVFSDWGTYRDAVRHVRTQTTRHETRTTATYVIPSPAQQFLTQTGKTLFKDMTFEALHRLQLDIEVYTPYHFPQVERLEDRIIIIALSDNRGWEKLLHVHDYPDERDLLTALVETLQEKDPDVIEGHNIYAFDLAFLMGRCAHYGVPFAIGRDGSVPRTFPSNMRFAERSVEFPAVDIAGRHVIDTYFQVLSFDVFKRDMPGYGLKVAAQYFGFAASDRTYIKGDKISALWETDPAQVLAYARDDVIETERLARHLSGSTFYLTQMLPMVYGQVARTGPAAKIEALMVREYVRQKTALPKSTWGSQTMGGYTDVFVTGVVGPIVYADVESLYPSIMLNYDIRPASDELGLFQDFLRKLTDLRFAAKNKIKQAQTAEEKSELDARQSSYKILINSFYGQLGFSHAIFNDFPEADRVAATGQKLLRQMIRLIREAGGRVVEVDTDGVLFIPPETLHDETAERAFIQRISADMPEGIRIGFDGRFKKMLSYKKKNYALLRYDGALKFKGSSLVSRSIEAFGRQFVREAIQRLLDEDVAGLHTLYLQVRDQILQHDWQVTDFQRTETLKNSPEEYLADVEAGKRTRAASYELALARRAELGQPIRKGDRISYYVTGSGTNITTFENCAWADTWRADQPDENTAYYLKRLDEFAQKFTPFFRDTDFRLVFSPEDLFGFDATGISLHQSERAPEALEDDVPF